MKNKARDNEKKSLPILETTSEEPKLTKGYEGTMHLLDIFKYCEKI